MADIYVIDVSFQALYGEKLFDVYELPTSFVLSDEHLLLELIDAIFVLFDEGIHEFCRDSMPVCVLQECIQGDDRRTGLSASINAGPGESFDLD